MQVSAIATFDMFLISLGGPNNFRASNLETRDRTYMDSAPIHGFVSKWGEGVGLKRRCNLKTLS